MFQGIFKSAIKMPDTNINYIFGTGSIPINIKSAQLATFADGTTKQQGYQVAEVNKLISTMLTGWDANGNKPKSMSDNYLELILSCDNGFVVKKRLQFPHIIAWQNDSTPYNIADVYKEFSIDNWLKADDFENPDITLVVEPTDEILTTSTATPPEATTEQSGRFYLYYRNLPVGFNRIHIDFHIKTKTEPIDFDLEILDGLSWKNAQVILASDEQAKINVLLSGVKDVYKFTGAEGNFEEITLHEWSALYQQIISLNPNNKFTHDLYFYLYEESEINTKLTELVQTINANLKKYITINTHYTVTHNIVNFGSNSIIYKNINSGSPIQYYSLDAIYEFSTTQVEYLVLNSRGVIEKKSGGANVLATDILLLAYNSLTDTYFGLLADQVNAVKVKTELKENENLLPANSRLNAYTPLRQSGAGLWVLRSGNAGNSITKEDGYFHVEMSRSANPALWIIRLDLTPYLNKTLRVRFSIKTENELKFMIGGNFSIATISASSEWATIEKNLTVSNMYGDWRIMLYNKAGTTSIFDIKDFGIYDDSNNTELKQLFLQLNSKYFDSDNKLAGKRISILGDSISTFGVPDQNNATGLWTYPGNRCRYPQSDLLTEVNECYWKRLIDENGMFLGVNESWAGSRVSNSQSIDSGDFGPNRCISSQTRINHLGDNGTPDIILVYGGANDAGGNVTIGTFNTENPINYTDAQIEALPVVTFADAYRAMLIRLLKTYPTARIIVMLPNFTTSYYSITNLDSYVEVVKEACDFFGVEYIDIRTAGITVYNQSTYFPDGIHPNAAGMELLYKLISAKFAGLAQFGL